MMTVPSKWITLYRSLRLKRVLITYLLVRSVVITPSKVSCVSCCSYILLFLLILELEKDSHNYRSNSPH